ncbi:DNM1 [Candida theae]|uniref:dynamin GTPase n=1 Tax=Candida theae TaxID=1198502 RepID=A0AAD5G180_9ASCO|nr:DNM1 [Candida theae]KAI5968476.1 DNM1 [Candida theae]
MSLQDLIPVVNKLQDIVTTTQLADIDLPILAVVGSQSCGKSSVLENIVGRDFLPRGTGIVTRRPLVLQLINVREDDPIVTKYPQQKQQQHSKSKSKQKQKQNQKKFKKSKRSSHLRDDQEEDDEDEEGEGDGDGNGNGKGDDSEGEESEEVDLEEHIRRMNGGAGKSTQGGANSSTRVEWGEFLHIPNKRFYNFREIRQEIENETLRIAGENKGISRLPINLKIYSPNVLNLTLVDLPGLTKIPIGDQPTDIERQTRNLILEYISKPNCIILAVSPANVDLVNSESLKLARQVDPTGKRTVGILTKLDLMDQGTNAVDILKGNVYPLKLGFIGIVNRSQQDISENKSLDDSLYSEEQFFANHPAYRAMAKKCGTKYLAQTLNKILMNHIRDRLPDIKAKLNTLMGQTEHELASYGELPNIGNSKEARGAMILTLMTKFANGFINSIEGNSVNEIDTKELCGGARIYYIYNEVFGSNLASINPTHNLSIQDIRTAIRNSTGPRPALFVPELAFDLLVKPQISLLEAPSQRCVELVYEEMMKILHNVCISSIGPELSRYPKLQTRLIEVVSDLLRERLGPTIKYVESLIEIHRAYINTNHPNFVGAAKAMSEVVAERQKQKEQESNSKLRLATQRILGKKMKSNAIEEDIEETADNEEEQDDDEEDTDEAVQRMKEDLNSVDDKIDDDKPRHGRSFSNRSRLDHASHLHPSSSSSSSHHHQQTSESYLNYFLGKDPIVHQQQMQAQAQLHPTPFKFPHPQETTLQFNTQFVNNGVIQNPHQHQQQQQQSYQTQNASPLLNGHLSHDHNKLSISDSSNDGSSTSFEGDTAILELTEREQMECELIRRLIISYFSIVREMIQDQVPKSIMCLLVNHVKQQIQNRLVVKLYNESLFDELLMEDEGIQAEREKCVELLKTYKEASKIISDVV